MSKNDVILIAWISWSIGISAIAFSGDPDNATALGVVGLISLSIMTFSLLKKAN